MSEFDWDTAPTICEVNGYRWVLGPQAEDDMNWFVATDWCKSVGGLLAPRDVLLHVYLNKDIKGGFADDYYWSSSEANGHYAWHHNFFNGIQNSSNKYFAFIRVRAVRAIKIGD